MRKSVKTRLHAKVELKAWIIDFKCLNHMTANKGKFIELEKLMMVDQLSLQKRKLHLFV